MMSYLGTKGQVSSALVLIEEAYRMKRYIQMSVKILAVVLKHNQLNKEE